MNRQPKNDPSQPNSSRLRLSALVLSAVMGLFVSYWSVFGLHTVLALLVPRAAQAPASWAPAVILGVLAGVGAAYRMFLEFTGYMDNS